MLVAFVDNLLPTHFAIKQKATFKANQEDVITNLNERHYP
jgi:hypothetical protein